MTVKVNEVIQILNNLEALPEFQEYNVEVVYFDTIAFQNDKLAFEIQFPHQFPVWVCIENFSSIPEKEIIETIEAQALAVLKQQASKIFMPRIIEDPSRWITLLNQWIYNYFDPKRVPQKVRLYEREFTFFNKGAHKLLPKDVKYLLGQIDSEIAQRNDTVEKYELPPKEAIIKLYPHATANFYDSHDTLARTQAIKEVLQEGFSTSW